MKLALVPVEGQPTVALEHEGIWYDYRRLQFALIEGITGVELGDIQQDMEADVLDALGDEGEMGLARTLDFARTDGRLEDFIIPGPSDFLLPFVPGKIVAVGRNYAAHAKELGNAVPEEPLFFCKSPTACVGSDDPIEIKAWYGRVDFEGELAVVIGAPLKDATEEEAQNAIAGYTLINDVSARDIQNADKERGHPWFRSKNFDTFCPVGPVIALPSALPWPLHVTLETRVNGELRQHGETSNFLFTVPALLAYISKYMTLEPGDLVATGTPEGVGPVADGDLVEISVSEIGVLRNRVSLLP